MGKKGFRNRPYGLSNREDDMVAKEVEGDNRPRQLEASLQIYDGAR